MESDRITILPQPTPKWFMHDSPALTKYSATAVKDGCVEQGNFDDSSDASTEDAPTVNNLRIMPTGANTSPSDVGEPGVPP